MNPPLELYLHNNRLQLATRDALYSDGHKYRPMVVAFEAIRDVLPAMQDVLLLGTGLASAVHVLHYMGFKPNVVTMVDIDQNVLEMAKQFLPAHAADKIVTACADARAFMASAAVPHCDLLVVDVFIGRSVPEGICEMPFLQQCRAHINPGGRFVMNYMVNNVEQWMAFRKRIATVFPQHSLLEFGLNKIIVGTIPSPV